MTTKMCSQLSEVFSLLDGKVVLAVKDSAETILFADGSICTIDDYSYRGCNEDAVLIFDGLKPGFTFRANAGIDRSERRDGGIAESAKDGDHGKITLTSGYGTLFENISYVILFVSQPQQVS